MPTSVLRRAAGSPALLPSAIRRIADAMLAVLELGDAELSVLLTNDTEIHALNLRHRHKDKPTDVLSFPLDEGGGADGRVSGTRVLGDVVISLDTAARQARGRKRELLPEVRFLLAHGILHLLGYDHGNPREKREMDALTRRLVRAVSEKSTKPLKRPGQSPKRGDTANSASRPKAGKARTRARARHTK
ncbi:MAG TPA: rRNA maturation RNase YbeY [Polyangiaceae bacterium]|jgi:probable rRNA maturation factor|nr:rRNA maturation RNase YbeY [Polyangiaceae bacterium]